MNNILGTYRLDYEYEIQTSVMRPKGTLVRAILSLTFVNILVSQWTERNCLESALSLVGFHSDYFLHHLIKNLASQVLILPTKRKSLFLAMVSLSLPN